MIAFNGFFCLAVPAERTRADKRWIGCMKAFYVSQCLFLYVVICSAAIKILLK